MKSILKKVRNKTIVYITKDMFKSTVKLEYNELGFTTNISVPNEPFTTHIYPVITNPGSIDKFGRSQAITEFHCSSVPVSNLPLSSHL